MGSLSRRLQADLVVESDRVCLSLPRPELRLSEAPRGGEGGGGGGGGGAVPEDSLPLTEELQPVLWVGPTCPQPQLVDLQARHLRNIVGISRLSFIN